MLSFLPVLHVKETVSPCCIYLKLINYEQNCSWHLSMWDCQSPLSVLFTIPRHPRITLWRIVPSCVFGVGGRVHISLWKLWRQSRGSHAGGPMTVFWTFGLSRGALIRRMTQEWGHWVKPQPSRWELLCECSVPALWLWLQILPHRALWPWSGLEHKLLLPWAPALSPMHPLPLWEKSMYSFCLPSGTLALLHRERFYLIFL